MGILDQVLGGVLGGVQGRGGGGRGRSPIVNAILMALATQALQHVLSRRRQGQGGGAAGPGGGGGLGDILGGALGGGGLGGLLEQFNRRGFADQTQSWVAPGPNQPLDASQVQAALDEDDIAQLSEETGLPRDELLREFARVLPGAIDDLTPDGRVPTDEELQALAATYDDQGRGV